MSVTRDRAQLKVPDFIRACLFDLDGVLTQTARIHSAAWKTTFDEFLRRWSADHNVHQHPFRLPDDYVRFVDGKLREDGVRSFLASRSITLPDGTSGDPPEAETVHGLANRKNSHVLQLLRTRGVAVYPSSVDFARSARSCGYPLAVVSSSKNCRAVLEAAGLEHLFAVRVDGVVAERDGLRGKPAPDMFVAAARQLGVAPAHAAVFEDAVAGVSAARAGSFGWIVGVDRGGSRDQLIAGGAHEVVGDLGELIVAP
jgi:beta-phosphoglucomutase family hydrolase